MSFCSFLFKNHTNSVSASLWNLTNTLHLLKTIQMFSIINLNIKKPLIFHHSSIVNLNPKKSLIFHHSSIVNLNPKKIVNFSKFAPKIKQTNIPQSSTQLVYLYFLSRRGWTTQHNTERKYTKKNLKKFVESFLPASILPKSYNEEIKKIIQHAVY